MRLQTQENKTAQIVLDLLDTRNMTQSALADEIGLTRQALSSKINGTRSFTKKDYVALADFFDTSVDYLMGRTLDPWPADNPPAGRGGEMSKSNCEPALLSSLETLQHNLQDAGMLRMKASLYSEAAVREALGDSEYRRISEKLDRRALLAQLDAVSLFLLQVLGLVSVGEGDGDLLSAEADVMNGAGEFPHLFAFCMIPEPSGATGSDTEIVERFVKRLSLCLH